MAGSSRRAVLLVGMCLALPALTGCRHYSYADETHNDPTPGFPVAKPVFDAYQYKGAAPEGVVETLKTVVAESGALLGGDKHTGLSIKMRAEMLPEKVPVFIDIINVLTIGLVPKVRDNTLVVEGELWAEGSDQASLKVKREGTMSSIETFLPFLFYPPSWFFLTDSYGGSKALPVYRKLAQQVVVELAGKSATATAPKAAPCPVCGEPRGDVSPCPHCGMN